MRTSKGLNEYFVVSKRPPTPATLIQKKTYKIDFEIPVKSHSVSHILESYNQHLNCTGHWGCQSHSFQSIPVDSKSQICDIVVR